MTGGTSLGTSSLTPSKHATSPAVVRFAMLADLASVKSIADAERRQLGFVPRGSLVRAIERNELLVACDTKQSAVLGFCHLYRRRDGITTIYHVAVASDARGQGIGRALLSRVIDDAANRGMSGVRLKCPADLPANRFYAHLGFGLCGQVLGASRLINLWQHLIVESPSVEHVLPDRTNQALVSDSPTGTDG